MSAHWLLGWSGWSVRHKTAGSNTSIFRFSKSHTDYFVYFVSLLGALIGSVTSLLPGLSVRRLVGWLVGRSVIIRMRSYTSMLLKCIWYGELSISATKTLFNWAKLG